MFNYLLKPFLGFLTVGGLGTGSYFLYKHSISKKGTESQGENRDQSIGSDSTARSVQNSGGTERGSTENGQTPGVALHGTPSQVVPTG